MKKAVITGASRGIGKATAEKFLAEGFAVVGTSTSGAGFEHENLSWVQLDLIDSGSIGRAAKDIAARGKIDVLVDNAGYLSDTESDFGDSPVDMDVLRRTLEVNLIGTIDFTEQLLPSLKEGGRILLLGSQLGSLTDAMHTASISYSISKAALGMYARQLAGQVKERDVRVFIVDPGWVRTDMGGPNATRAPEEPAREIYELAVSDLPTGRFWREGKERSW